MIHFGDKGYFDISGEKRFDKEQILAFCKNKGIALFDTARKVCRLKDNADDNFLEIVEGTDVLAILEPMPECTTIVTTGGKASEELQTYFEKKGIKVKIPKVGEFVELKVSKTSPPSEVLVETHIRWWRMPSSSRAYPMKLEKKADYYKRLFE